MREMLRKLVRSDEGQDLIEYGLWSASSPSARSSRSTLIGPKVKTYFDNLNAVDAIGRAIDFDFTTEARGRSR